tara:strand:- start:1281 stop:1562 length:282 start_codon:yes stop_codon:yes gene_type:complete
MKEEIINLLYDSGKVKESEEWDALYQDELPIVVAPSTGELEEALNRLDSVGGYGYVATLKKNLFSFNPKMLSKRAGLIDENGNLLKAARIPKK